MLKQTKSPTVPPAFHAECPGCHAPNQPGYYRVKRKQVFGGAGIATIGVLALPFFWWTGAPIAAIAGGSAMMAATKKKRYLFCQECGAVYNLHTKRPSTLKKRPANPGHVFVGGEESVKSPPSIVGGSGIHDTHARSASAPSLVNQQSMPPNHQHQSPGSFSHGGEYQPRFQEQPDHYQPGYQSSPTTVYRDAPSYKQPPQHPTYESASSGRYVPPQQPTYESASSGRYTPPQQGSYESPSSGRYPPPQQGSYESPSSGRFQSPPQPSYASPSSGRFQSPPQPSYASPNSGRFQPPKPAEQQYNSPNSGRALPTPGYQASPSSGRYQPPSYAIVAPVGRPI